MQITEQIIERIARRVFNTMFSPALRQSNVATAGSGSSVSWADNAGHANEADSASTADSATSATTAGSASSVPWSGVTNKPAYATRWPSWTEVTSKPTSKTIWGQTYLNASSAFQNVTGSLSSVTDINMSGVIKIGDIYIGHDADNTYIEIYKLDENNNKIAASLCAYGGVSALGVGTGGGGGGGTSLLAVWAAMGNATDEQINISHLAGNNGALATMTGYTTSGKNYAVQKDTSNHLYVNVPWTDTVYTLPAATSAALGGIKIGYTTDGDNRNYAVQLSSNQAYVNVPWTDTNTWRPVVDNLTSTDTDKSLSANQGYNLANGSARDSTKLPLAGGTMTGTLNLRSNGYKADNAAGINCNNSDIIGLNSLYTADLSDSWSESIQFARTNGNYDSFRAADGTFYFGINSGTERVWITPSAGSADMGLVLNGTSYRMEFMIGSGNVNRGIYDRTSGINKWLLYFDASNTILNYGNVGIGVSNPSYRLQVDGQVYANDSIHVVNSSASVHVGSSTSNRLSLHWSSDNNRGLYDHTGNWVVATNGTNTFLMKGNVGIGTTSPGDDKLKVAGSICTTVGLYSEGYVDGLAYNTASDKRLKDIIDYDAVPHIDDIANAPAIHFTWKNKKDEKIHVGTIAQYWQKIIPECVYQSKRGHLTMNYDVIALVNTIALAREINALKHEISELKNKVQ